MANLKSMKDALSKTQSERDAKSREQALGDEGRERLQNRLDDLQKRSAAGLIDDQTFDREKRTLLSAINATETLGSHGFSWRRFLLAGAVDGGIAAAIALDAWLWSQGLALVAFGVLLAAVALTWIRFAATNRTFAGVWGKNLSPGFGLGPGFYGVAGALVAATWGSVPMRLFADVLTGLGGLYWVVCLIAWPAAGWKFAFRKKIAARAAEKWFTEHQKSVSNASSSARLLRMRALGGLSAERFAGLTLAVSLAVVGPVAANFLAAHASPMALRASDVSRFTAADAAVGERLAKSVQQQAAAALAAAQREHVPAAPSYLDQEALRNARPGGAVVGWSKMYRDGWHVAPSLSAFYGGQWRPAGLWVFDNRGSDLSERSVLSAGVFFVPFYANANCSSIAKDLYARDADWRLRQSSYAIGDQGQQRQLDSFVKNVPSEEPTIACVGEPIALQSSAPIGDRERDLMIYKRVALLNDLGDWSDFWSWVGAHHPVLGMRGALRFKLYKMSNTLFSYLLRH